MIPALTQIGACAVTESVTPPGTLPFEEPERWLPVVGWEGLYEVSDLGRVRSIRRMTASGMRGGAIRKLDLLEGRYLTVMLTDGARREHRLVHHLVLEAFVEPCPEGEETRHGPNGGLDNRLSQLCWGTKAENGADKIRDGVSHRGESHYRAKLTSAIVAECRKRAAEGESQTALAREFGVGQQCMGYAISGKNWPGVAVPPVPVTSNSGENQWNAKLTWMQVTEIRERYAAGELQSVLAEDFGVRHQVISKIVTWKSWRGGKSA